LLPYGGSCNIATISIGRSQVMPRAQKETEVGTISGIKNYMYDVDGRKLYDADSTGINVSDFEVPSFYDSPEFHDYHHKFADEVVRLGVASNGGKPIGYCYFGARDGVLRSPYSSPFSLIYLRRNYRTEDACSFVKGIKDFAVIKGFSGLQLTLPPKIYGNQLINTLEAALFSEGFRVSSIELNNYFDLTKYSDLATYLKGCPPKVRKNYRRALRNGLVFEQVDANDVGQAYDVIRVNREQMGYPLKISENQMRDLVKMDGLVARAFVVKSLERPLAAAIVFDITDAISQVIYWGDIVEYRDKRPMDLLTSEIFNVYKKLAKRYLDIGPSSENGIINLGLADFKMSIGCNTDTKLVFTYETE
jgi:hypothetical protein